MIRNMRAEDLQFNQDGPYSKVEILGIELIEDNFIRIRILYNGASLVCYVDNYGNLITHSINVRVEPKSKESK